MRREPARVLDDRDLQTVDHLDELGLSRNAAKIVVFLAQVDEATSRDVERGADLRQPQVSLAMRRLRRRGWVEKRDIKGEGKGRPIHGYRLGPSFSTIVDEIEQAKREELEQAMTRVERVRSWGRDRS